MRDLPEELRLRIESTIGTRIRSVQRLGGGCIANASRVETEDSEYFLKWAEGDAGSTFAAEAAGLEALRDAGSDIVVPRVHAVETAREDKPGFLITDFVESGNELPGFWEGFGRSLANLHRVEGDGYGFHVDNFIGRLPQDNGAEAMWPEFFARRRLLPQRRMCVERGRWKSTWNAHFERLISSLNEHLPHEPEASILHGDLWRGNILIDEHGNAALIDPATYYGDRETDLAMAELFGGFDPRFFEAYREAWPLEPGYDERRDIYQLYHLINHLNHFGGSYAGSVETILTRYRG